MLPTPYQIQCSDLQTHSCTVSIISKVDMFTLWNVCIHPQPSMMVHPPLLAIYNKLAAVLGR